MPNWSYFLRISIFMEVIKYAVSSCLILVGSGNEAAGVKPIPVSRFGAKASGEYKGVASSGRNGEQASLSPVLEQRRHLRSRPPTLKRRMSRTFTGQLSSPSVKDGDPLPVRADNDLSMIGVF